MTIKKITRRPNILFPGILLLLSIKMDLYDDDDDEKMIVKI